MKNIINNINKAFDHRIRLGIMSILMVNEYADFKMLSYRKTIKTIKNLIHYIELY